LRAVLRTLAVILALVLNLAWWGSLVLAGGVVKLLTFGLARRRILLFLSSLADRWIAGNDRIFDALLRTRWIVNGVEGLVPEGHYLLISNHVSWLDIFALQRAFHGKTAFPRFFIKSALIWFPIVGQAAWALDFPFMRRYSPEYLKEHPEKRGRDLETTRMACQRYRDIPVAILNFVEGTRFTREKHEDQQSPYRHLLRPRAGGIGFVVASLADQLHAVIDVTLVYPHRDVSIWDFVRNRVPWIRVEARRAEVPPELRTAAITEPGPAREQFKEWVGEIWRRKDETISQILLESRQ
jgi:1-acyl-sn-glycerol-3-phosphate acyltransferase